VLVCPSRRRAVLAETAQRVPQRGARRVQDRDVVQAGGAGRRGRATFRFPGVEAEVMVITPGGQEQRVAHLEDDVEAEYVDVEVLDAVDVGRLQMDMADAG